MANGHAIGVFYAGINCQDDPTTPSTGGMSLEIVRGLAEPPVVRGDDDVIPDRDFVEPLNRRSDHLTIELRGWVWGGGATETAARESFQAERAAFRSLFTPRRDPASLVLVLEDGSMVAVSARPQNVAWGDPTVPTLRGVSVELRGYEDWADYASSGGGPGGGGSNPHVTHVSSTSATGHNST